jgi:hypothetical protein
MVDPQKYNYNSSVQHPRPQWLEQILLLFLSWNKIAYAISC